MSGLEEIPPISDPLGKYWDQPCRSKILIDDKIALMDRQTFRDLMAYDTSIPSGVYVGKMWSRTIPANRSDAQDREFKDHFARLLCWYDDHPDRPESCLIKSREVVFL